jgi:hypothetical protein
MKLSDKVVKVMRAENISPEEMRVMLDHAAITSLRSMNRRYVHWLFKIVGGHVIDMQHTELVQLGSGTTKMLEDHEDCGGVGCKDCGWAGQVARWVSDRETPTHEALPRYA